MPMPALVSSMPALVSSMPALVSSMPMPSYAEYIAQYIQEGLLTVQEVWCIRRGAVHRPAGTGWF